MNQELRKEVIDDYRMVVMEHNSTHIEISDEIIIALWTGLDMSKEMNDISESIAEYLYQSNQSFISHYAKGESMQSWIREAVWKKYKSMTRYDCGNRFVFRKRMNNEIRFVKTLSAAEVLARFLDEVMEKHTPCEIGNDDEDIYTISLNNDAILNDVMCEVTKEGKINIRLIPDQTNIRQDCIVKAIDTFGLYQFCEHNCK